MSEFAELGYRIIFRGVWKVIKFFIKFFACAFIGFVQIIICFQWQRLFTTAIILFVSFTVLSYVVPRPYLFTQHGGIFTANIVNFSLLLSTPTYLVLVYKKGDIK